MPERYSSIQPFLVFVYFSVVWVYPNITIAEEEWEFDGMDLSQKNLSNFKYHFCPDQALKLGVNPFLYVIATKYIAVQFNKK